MSELSLKPLDTSIVDTASGKITGMLKWAINIQIVSNHEKDVTSEFLKNIKGEAKTLKAERENFREPIDELVKAMQRLFNPPRDKLVLAESILKQKLIAWDDKQEAIRRKEEEKLRIEAEEKEKREKAKLEKKAVKAEEKGDTEKAEALREQKEEVAVVAPVLPVEEKTKGQSIKVKWYAEVENKIALLKSIVEGRVSPECVSFNQRMLDSLAGMNKDMIKIAGLKFRSRKEMSSRSI